MLLKYPIQPTSSAWPRPAAAAPPASAPLAPLFGISLLGGMCIVELAVIWDVCL